MWREPPLATMVDVKWLTQDARGGERVDPTGLARWVRPIGPTPRPNRWELLFDAVLAFCVAIPVKPERIYTFDLPMYRDVSVDKGVQIAIAIGVLVPLCFRRRFPLAALWVIMFEIVFIPAPFIMVAAGVLVAAYSAAVYSPMRRLALWSLPVVLIQLWVFNYFALVPGTNNLVAIPFGVPVAAVAALGGAEVRRRAVQTVVDHKRQREEMQQEAIRRAVEGERSRIARELHDVVTHNVSVMIVMAGAARKVLEKSPEQATEALLAVEASGRAAMAELRQVMGLLTEDVQEQHKLAPEPGLDQLGALISRIRTTGVPIAYRVHGTPRPLPPGLDLTAYRVVQEALTNTVKHASGASVDILVEYRLADLALDITDSGGVPGQTAAAGNGRGLIGLRERVAVHGGTVQAAPQPHGGYRVRVRIPLPVEDAV